jgi:hypothetical protein
MADPTSCIPWQGKKEWQALSPFFDTIKKVNDTNLDPVYKRAEAIRQLFESLSRPMDDLCAATCINCRDICCQKATIWYDFKDLLYLYFAFDKLPEAQISKNKDNSGLCHCGHFSATGCLLSRLERPFVCTWYLCPDQKTVITSGRTTDGKNFPEIISHIKRLRNEMEREFCGISAGKIAGQAN